MKIFKKSRQAFTLIEAAIVLFIISLLMLLILPNLGSQRQKAVETHATAMAVSYTHLTLPTTERV